MTVKAILYDHDGTLVDSETVHFAIWRDVLKEFGAELAVEIYQKYHAGMPTLANAQDIIDRFGLSHTAEDLAQYKDEATQIFLENDKFPLMPGVMESIRFFVDLNLPLAVVTGAGRLGVTTSINKHDMAHYFNEIISADDVSRSKPAPDCYLLAAKRLGLAPSQCIAIEDTIHGAEAAHSAGIPCVVVPNSMSNDSVFPHAVQVCQDIMQASQWIKQQYT